MCSLDIKMHTTWLIRHFQTNCRTGWNLAKGGYFGFVWAFLLHISVMIHGSLEGLALNEGILEIQTNKKIRPFLCKYGYQTGRPMRVLDLATAGPKKPYKMRGFFSLKAQGRVGLNFWRSSNMRAGLGQYHA